MYTNRSSYSTASGPYGLLSTDQPNVACMRASRAPSSICDLRWTLEMVADVEAMVVRLRLAAVVGIAPAAVPTLACNISQ